MSEERVMKLNIHFCGSMMRKEENYEYVGDKTEFKSVDWNISTIGWRKFEDFIKESQVTTPIALIFYKKTNEGMEKLQYIHDSLGDEFYNLCEAGKEGGSVDVYIEHNCSDMGHMGNEHEMSNLLVSTNFASDESDKYGGVNEEEYDAEDESEEREEKEEEEEEMDEEEEEIESDDSDIPKDDMDVVESENEIAEEGKKDTSNKVDDGEDVVPEVGDAKIDGRFTSLFEEAENREACEGEELNDTKRETREIGVKETVTKEAIKETSDESDIEYDLGKEPYPDTPVDTDEEWERLKEKPRKKRGKDRFHGDYEEEPYFWLFQTFNSGDEFKSQLLRYALKTQFDVKMSKSEARRIAAVCCTEDCKWRIFCSVEVPINKWMVKVCHNTHNHEKNSRVRLLKQGVIASLYREELRRKVYMTANEIRDSIKEKYNCVVSRSKCSKARKIALDVVLQDQATQFTKLWDYEAELIRSNEGISTEICTVPLRSEQVFDRFYICFKELRNTWKKVCRPVIGLDGCFCRWDLKGELLAAVGRDADNRIYPIAWAIVRGEDNESWAWFINKLKVDLDLGLGDNITIISDKQKGIVKAIADDLPNAEHRMCARHIYANFKKNFSASVYKVLFWAVAYSYSEGEYDKRMQSVHNYDRSAYEALLRTEPKTWCRAFFNPTSQCMDVHNNLCESFNRIIREARLKPIINLLETVRKQAMDRISKRFKETDPWNAKLTPITLKVLEKARIDGKYCSTIHSSKNLNEVNEFDNGYIVCLASHRCAYRRWDLTDIPCKHAVCVINDNAEDMSKYVSPYYSTERWKGTYADNIKPVNGENNWKKTGRIPIGVPEFRRPPGRPKIYRRKKDPYESPTREGKVTRHGRTIHCSHCGEAGHNKAKCKNPKKVEKPKNKRGRPRKNPLEAPVRRPPRSAFSIASKSTRKTSSKKSTSQPVSEKTTMTAKTISKKDTKGPSKRRKTDNSTASSTQPAHLGESSTSTFPQSSSALQPSISSKQSHVPNPRCGRPLKVKKSVNIPKGYGILNCPYTDRVFEVWGSRAHDISGTSSEQPPLK